MNLHSTRVVLLGAALLALPVGLSLGLVGTGYLRQPPTAAPAFRATWGEEEQRGHHLDSIQADVFQRLEAKQVVAREVIAGHLRLVEAASRFRALDAASSSFSWDLFREANRGQTDEERHCREVIGYVNTLLADNPEQARAVGGPLEVELEGLLRSGPLRLAE